jgi:hypothetical protein
LGIPISLLYEDNLSVEFSQYYFKTQGAKPVASLTHVRSATLAIQSKDLVEVEDGLGQLQDVVKACVFHRLREKRQGVDELQVKVTIASPMYDLQGEYDDILSLVEEAIADTVAFLPKILPNESAKQAVIAGAVEAVELSKREAIDRAQLEIKKIQSYINDQETELAQLTHSVAASLIYSSEK